MPNAMSRALRWCRAQYQVRKDSVAFARSLGVTIGEGSHIYSTEIDIFGDHPFLVTLGKRCFITEGVRFVTHDGAVLVFRDRLPQLDLVAPIVLGDNVYIGVHTIIMPGVRIGNNCIIGAGAVVTRDIPDDSVAVGVPARVIKSAGEYKKRAIEKSIGTGAMGGEKTEYLRGLFGRK